MTFNCEKCGACCRSIGCDKLKDNLCTIYETRPDICRVDVMYNIRKQNNSELTKEDYYKMNKLCCEWLRRRDKNARTN